MRVSPPVTGRRWRLPQLLCLILGLWAAQVCAEQFRVADIRVEGLQRIAPGTVFTYLPVQVGDTVGEEVTGNVIRALYQTGFFDDVRVERDGNVLVLQVQERPAIARIEFVGNRDLDEKALREAVADIGLKEGRVFNRAVLERIEQELERQYFSRGKYGVLVQSTVSPLERNRVAIRIDVTEGLTARIKQVNIIGNDAFSEKELLKQFQLGKTRWHSIYTKNDQYSKQKLAGDLEALRSFYLDRGFIQFEIKSTQVSISPDKKDIYVTVVISEGDRFSVSDIKLAGELPVPAEKLFPLIELRRGESFGVRVQLRYWWGSKDAGIKQSDRPGLCSTPGRYTAVARFSGSGGPIIRDLAKDWLDRVPLPDQPPTQSLPLRFVLPPGACATRAGGVTCC